MLFASLGLFYRADFAEKIKNFPTAFDRLCIKDMVYFAQAVGLRQDCQEECRRRMQAASEGGRTMHEFFNGDTNLYGYGMKEQTESGLPEKLKQMGNIESQVRIFVEDYVYTYLYQYGKSNGGREKIAILVGRHLQVNGQEAVIISGAIQGKGTIAKNGVESFSDETWEYVGSQMETYFKGMEIIGWVHLQPGFGSFLMTRDEVFHQEFFKEPWQILFVLDCQDKLDTFYIHGEKGYGLRQARGYYIYYDKNTEMQEYMLDNMVVTPKVSAEDEAGKDFREKDATGEEVVKETSERVRRHPKPEERVDAAGEIRRVLQRRAKQAELAQKGKYSMLLSVSCVLCVTCLCMGFALVSGMNRLKSLEGEFLSVQSSYVQLAQNFEGLKVQSAFAEDKPTPVKEVVKQPEEKEVQPKEEEAKEVEKTTYTVQAGDSLLYISNKYYSDEGGMARIMEANNIDNADMIFAGQVLVIPEK